MAKIDRSESLVELRELVRKLDATGPEGFEGLLAAVLTQVTGTLFILAKSGSQHGKDGQGALDAGAVAFEAKLYDQEIAKNEVLSKLTQLFAADPSSVDLWILGSTGTVAAQDSATVESFGRKAGIATFVADWSGLGLPTLATLLALEPSATAAFLAKHVPVDEVLVLRLLAGVRTHPQFAARAAEVEGVLNQSSLSPGYAVTRNRNFLNDAFRSSKRAQIVFGQMLAPADPSRAAATDRLELRQRLAIAVDGKPDGTLVAILGAEGNGKSWLFAQTWLHEPAPPLTLILPAASIEDSSLESLESLLINKLIAQTDDAGNDIARARWLRYFKRWQGTKPANRPRLVVYVDGLNQEPQVPWARAIDALADALERLGGRLVLSCRKLFFDERIGGRLATRVLRIEVPEWTLDELRTLLAPHGVSLSSLRPAVVKSMKNPRILGIALDLFQASDILKFQELSVNRLLFEHLRRTASTSGGDTDVASFVGAVRRHADEIVKRLKSQELEDLRVFDRAATEEQFELVSAGRFFVALDSDPTLYAITDEGLPVALGLSVLNAAQKAERNNLNVEHALSVVLDPIAALDQTAEVLLAAVLACVIDRPVSDDVVASLIAAFVGLQNTDPRHVDEFRALARATPNAYLLALEKIGRAERESIDTRWLIAALQDNRGDTATAERIKHHVCRWLRMYSDDPTRLMMIPKRDATQEDWVAEYQKRLKEQADKRAAFGQAERELWQSYLRLEEGEYEILSRISFALLAGAPLAPFAEALRNWSLVDAYSRVPGSRVAQEFAALIQFNRIDWCETRAALMLALQILNGPDVSRTGRWASVRVLWATGASDDAQVAEEVVKGLTKDQPHFENWRWIEQLCATDPCDPDSPHPANIDATASRVAQLDVTALSRKNHVTQADRLFRDSLPGLARFAPQAAVSIIRAFAANALTRTREDFLFAILELGLHTALLEDPVARRFVAKGAAVAGEYAASGAAEEEIWSAEQIALEIAFPHMTGEEQLEALIAHPVCENLFLDLIRLFTACPAQRYEVELEQAYLKDDAKTLFRVLAFGQFTHTELSARCKAIIARLIGSPDRFVRLAALGLIVRLDDLDLLRALVTSGWSASAVEGLEVKFEAWYGSVAMALAAGRQLVTLGDSLQRMSMSGWVNLVATSGHAATALIVQRLETAIAGAVAYATDLVLPQVELQCRERPEPNLFLIQPKRGGGDDPREFIRILNESPETQRKHNRESREAFQASERKIRAAGAELMTEALPPALIEAIRDLSPQTVEVWTNRFLALDSTALSRVHHVAVLVARALSRDLPKHAVKLFERLQQTPAHVQVTVGPASIPAIVESIWKATDSDEIRELRFARLDRTRTDYELATEVLAALEAGKEKALEDYALERRARVEPYHIARAAMVAGFSSGEPWAVNLLAGLKGCHGLPGCAHEAATYALDRHRWSRHWMKLMAEATDEVEYWRYAILLARIGDGRSRLEDPPVTGSIDSRYRQTVDNMCQRRMNRWREKRIKTLFGEGAPDSRFLA